MDLDRLRQLGGIPLTENKTTTASARYKQVTLIEGLEDEHADAIGEYEEYSKYMTPAQKAKFDKHANDFDTAHDADDDEAMEDAVAGMNVITRMVSSRVKNKAK